MLKQNYNEKEEAYSCTFSWHGGGEKQHVGQ
jgi:hypothetical protein